MGSMTITEFLLARIAEDEAAARAATLGEWWYDPTKVNSVDRGEAVFAGQRGLHAVTIASTGPADDPASMADAAHIARHDPARVLAECEAKRRIVEREESGMRTQWRRRSDEHRRTWGQWLEDKGRGEMLTLRDLASVYADHPGFDPAWRL
jgi:hypothetical protein